MSVREAATVVVLRAQPSEFEVLLVQRSQKSRFMGGAYVFPGGVVEPDADEQPSSDPWRGAMPWSRHPEGPAPSYWRAALRELAEEAAIDLGAAERDAVSMAPWSRWRTPSLEPRRYDAWFFVAELRGAAEAVPDGVEAVAHAWMTPAAALSAHDSGALYLPPPTRFTLAELAAFSRPQEVLSAAETRCYPCVLPRVAAVSDDGPFVVFPWDPEYSTLDGEGVDWRSAGPFAGMPSRLTIR